MVSSNIEKSASPSKMGKVLQHQVRHKMNAQLICSLDRRIFRCKDMLMCSCVHVIRLKINNSYKYNNKTNGRAISNKNELGVTRSGGKTLEQK